MASSTTGCVLVTGGAGFVGSHCIVELLNKNFSVVAVDNFANSVKGNSEKPECLKRIEKITGKELFFEELDLCDKEAVKRIMKKVLKSFSTSS